MNKHIYMAVMVSVLVGLYLPKTVQLVATLMIISSMITYVAINHREFFGTKKADSATDTDDQVN